VRGADEYAVLFNTGQYGCLYIVSGCHARGLTFHIQVLPEGEKAIPNGTNNLCTNSNAVEVYGIVSGDPGWTESYGWLHRGPWIEDFKKLAQHRAQLKENAYRDFQLNEKALAVAYEARERKLLAGYKGLGSL